MKTFEQEALEGMSLPPDMDAIHARIGRAVEANQRLPEVDLNEVSRVALKAYSTATRGGRAFEGAEAALEAISADASRMRLRALDDLESGNWGEKSKAAPRREFAYDFVFAALPPIVGGALVWWLTARESDLAAKALLFCVCLISGFAVLVALARLWGGQTARRRLGAWNSVLVHSGGALAAGAVLLVGLGLFVQREGQESRLRDMEVQVKKVNQAAAVALAAINAGASVSQTQDAVTRTTEVNWIKFQDRPSDSASLAASLKFVRATAAELRVASPTGGSPMLASFLTSKSGETVPYADYLLGTVVKADLTNVTLSVGPKKELQVLTLAHGTLPPPMNTEVVAVINSADKSTAFLQPIDADVLALKR